MPGESPCRRRYLDLGYWFPGGGVARKCSPRGKWKNTIGAYVQPNGARWAGAPPPYLLPSSQQPGHPCLPEALYDEIFTRYPSAPHEVSGPPNTTITTAQRQQHRRPVVTNPPLSAQILARLSTCRRRATANRALYHTLSWVRRGGPGCQIAIIIVTIIMARDLQNSEWSQYLLNPDR